MLQSEASSRRISRVLLGCRSHAEDRRLRGDTWTSALRLIEGTFVDNDISCLSHSSVVRTCFTTKNVNVGII
jgi:hypothetical protein